FFAQYALARFGRGDGLLGVQVDRRGDVNGVYLVVGDQFAPIAIPPLSAEFIRERLGQINARAAHGDELTFGNASQSGRDPLARDVAASDQSPSKFIRPDQCHKLLPRQLAIRRSERRAQDMTILLSGKQLRVLPFDFLLKYFIALFASR